MSSMHISKRSIVFIIVAIILAGGLVAEYLYLNNRYSEKNDDREPPPTKQVGSFEASSGVFNLYMHKKPIKSAQVKSGYILREGNRLETLDGAWARFDGCISAPDFTKPVKFYLRENSAIGLMNPPAIDVEKGSFAVHVPRGSMGIRVNIKLLEHAISAQCLTEDADMLIVRDNDRLFIYVYRGSVRLWNMQGETYLDANQKGEITPGEAPAEGKPLIDNDFPEDVKEFFKEVL